MLTKVDKATMACGLEARTPFLDHRLVETAINFPAAMKVSGSDGKLILKELGESYLPRQVLYRPKHGFNVPLSLWFRDSLRPFVDEILNPSSLRQAGYFRPETVQAILDRHGNDPNIDLSNHILALLWFELWRRAG
jgi:asparagine synthase (glutamine-hydrolysing)